MEALLFLLDICAMFLLVRWSAKSGSAPAEVKKRKPAPGQPFKHRGMR